MPVDKNSVALISQFVATVAGISAAAVLVNFPFLHAQAPHHSAREEHSVPAFVADGLLVPAPFDWTVDVQAFEGCLESLLVSAVALYPLHHPLLVQAARLVVPRGATAAFRVDKVVVGRFAPVNLPLNCLLLLRLDSAAAMSTVFVLDQYY